MKIIIEHNELLSIIAASIDNHLTTENVTPEDVCLRVDGRTVQAIIQLGAEK